jgi:uncharacterized protein YcnI
VLLILKVIVAPRLRGDTGGAGLHGQRNIWLRLTNLQRIGMNYFNAKKIMAACAAAMLTLPAFSRVSLLVGAAPAGSNYKAVFQVREGCQNMLTMGITVRIPAGFEAPAPYPKAGWIASVRQEPLEDDQSVSVVSWTAASPEAGLKGSYPHDFILRGKLPGTAGPLWFKVLQTCENGQIDWSEIPAADTSIKDLKTPAVLLRVGPPKGAAKSARSD